MRIKKLLVSSILIIFSGLCLTSCELDNKPQEDNEIHTMENYIDNLIKQTSTYVPAWNNEGYKGRWNYIDGVFLNSIINYSYQRNSKEYQDFFFKYINYYINQTGNFINPSDGNLGYRSGELDSVCASKILFDAYELSNDSRYLTAIEYTYDSLMLQSRVKGSTNFSHKESYLNQIWLDGMYMYAPFYARYALLHEKSEIFDEIKDQYEYIRNHMFDADKNLYYHAYDSTKSIFWSNSNTGCSPSFWLRSMGWYIVSLVDVLDYFPNGENKDYLIDLLKEAIEGIMTYQDSESKMFYQLIDQSNKTFLVNASYLEKLKNTQYLKNGMYEDTNIKNYLESSGSSMISYACMKASNNKYIDTSYLQKGKDIFDGIYEHSFSSNILHNICITAGLGPYSNPHRDGTYAYYLAEPVGSNDAKGVGPFIMAFLEYSKTNN